MRAVFELTIRTPLSIGWYDPSALDPRFYIRPTSVKGLWRWWARAVAAGALYEAGCAGNTKLFLKQVSEIVGKGLGLGTTGMASKYRLTVKVEEPPEVKTICTEKDDEDKELQRLRLLTMPRRAGDIKIDTSLQYARGGLFKLEVEGDHAAFATAVNILAMALTLSGLGKGGRKSLGVLDIIRVEGDISAKYIRNLIDDVTQDVKRLVRRCEGGGKPELPPIPAVVKDFFEVYRVSADFRTIHNIFLRQYRSRGRRGQDPMHLHAWFLGLPRSQKGTGYIVPQQKDFRRPSAVFAAAHGSEHRYGGETYLSIFLSSDWPDQITWQGLASRTPITIKTLVSLTKAKDKFLETLKQLQPQRVWPS